MENLQTVERISSMTYKEHNTQLWLTNLEGGEILELGFSTIEIFSKIN